MFLPRVVLFRVVILHNVIDPFNKSNIYSFPLLTSLKLKVFNRISKAEHVVNSGKLCILDLLKCHYDQIFIP